jgi:murein DD-endopeptidase MepM/ murein hydrolase activator NlpD
MFTIKKKIQYNLILFVITSIFLTSCSTNMHRFTKDPDLNQIKSKKIFNDSSPNSANGNINPSGQWIVRSGETIQSISQETGVSIEDIAYYNSLKFPYDLKDGTAIYVGSNDKLIVSRLKSASANNDVTLSNMQVTDTYIVQAGDTLSSIASRFNLNVDFLIEINNIDNPQYISIGQLIELKSEVTSNNTKTTLPIINKINKIEQSENLSQTEEKTQIKNPQFRWPVYGRVVNAFGEQLDDRINNGVYISAPSGSDVSASESGVITFAGAREHFGNLIIVKHPNSWVSTYAHLGSVNVIIGEKIRKGQPIGIVGMTGSINSPQLYFEIRRGTIVQNPEDFLD